MKQSLSEIRQLQKIAGILGAKIKPGVIRENEYKELKEEQGITIELKDDLTATMASDASKKLTIPKGAKVTVVKKRLDNEPTLTQLEYDGKLVNVNAGPFINNYFKGK
jgi:transcription antitermination factor NusG